MQKPPFIALGGGLAGAAFAVELARNGAPVSVLEGTRGPHHKSVASF
jgi:menaquinone-9 beta-reductase